MPTSAQLTGEFEHQLDSRGRVAIPGRFRPSLEHGGFICPGWYGCVFLFPWEEWRKIEDKLSQVRITDMDGDIVREFFSTGNAVKLDRQGRVLVPASLRGHGGIETEVVVRGVITRVEIWAKDRWAAFRGEQFEPQRIMQRAAALGI